MDEREVLTKMRVSFEIVVAIILIFKQAVIK